MNIGRWCVRIATLGPIGYLTASGTVTSLCTLPIVYWAHYFLMNQWQYLVLVGILFFLGISIVSRALDQLKRQEDPSEIVFDELVGCLLVFWGTVFTTQLIVVGFLIFRALDVISVNWVKKTEGQVGAWGVMSDDIVAAIITNVILRLLF